jgi:hypothetical protein
MRIGLSLATTLIVIAAATAQAQAQAQATTAARPREACAADLQKFCPGVQPGGGRVKQCLRPHRDELSTSCAAALETARAARLAHKQGEAPSQN